MIVNEIDSILRDEFVEEEGFRLDDVVGDKEVILYGAGNGLITFYSFVVKKFDLNIKAILDNKFECKTQWREIPAGPLSSFDFSREVRYDAVVVITVGKKEYHGQIVDLLNDYGFKNIVFAFDIYEYHLSHSLPDLSDVSVDYFRQHRKEIKLAYSQLADDLSKRVFFSVLQTYISKKPVSVPSSPLEEQYFPSDVMLNKGVSRFINCGSYDGDTLRELKKRYYKIDALACFEPDANNYIKLSRCLNEWSLEISDVAVVMPCAVWDKAEVVKFNSDNKINSTIADEGDSLIQCVSIDQSLFMFSPTYINMDVEGAEIEALYGAENTIQIHKPDLAICVYHKPEHLWRILVYIRSIVPEYQFYMRNYTGYPAETVLYATV